MTLDVEHIVREVVAELERRQRAPEATPAAKPAKPAAPTSDARELVVCSRVVSLAEIGDRLGHVRRLVVPADAVITPSARDAIADHNITITFGPSDQPTASTATRVLLLTARTGYDPAGLAAGLQALGIAVETQTSDCLIRSTDALAERVRDRATLGLLLTPHVSAAVCLANRLPGVRAVAAANPAAAVEAARAVGANVLIVDPQGKSLFQLKQIAGEFCRGGPWKCPESLRTRLA